MIRPAKKRDIQDIDRLLFQVNNVHADDRPDLFKRDCKKYTDEELEKIIEDDKRPIFVYTDERDEQVLGYAFCIIEEYENDHNMVDRKTLYIDDLCVDEEVRGRHIGRLLYEHVLRYAKHTGCYNVTLNVWSLNTDAMKFYEALGLKPYKTGMEVIVE
ncbi:MAG: GNAT family N-acetyltransferase [Lachnospiraceae bacterium]|nr:GNAT family N-acetyltransferase [Lachnospiraceae bacterium]